MMDPCGSGGSLWRKGRYYARSGLEPPERQGRPVAGKRWFTDDQLAEIIISVLDLVARESREGQGAPGKRLDQARSGPAPALPRSLVEFAMPIAMDYLSETRKPRGNEWSQSPRNRKRKQSLRLENTWRPRPVGITERPRTCRGVAADSERQPSADRLKGCHAGVLSFLCNSAQRLKGV